MPTVTRLTTVKLNRKNVYLITSHEINLLEYYLNIIQTS